MTLLHRPLRVSPMEHIGTRRKVTGGHFAPSGPGLNLIDVNGVYYVYNQYTGYDDFDEEIHEVKTATSGHLGSGWTWYQVSPTPTPAETRRERYVDSIPIAINVSLGCSATYSRASSASINLGIQYHGNYLAPPTIRRGTPDMR